MTLEIIIKAAELTAAKNMYSRKLDNPLLKFHKQIKARDNSRSGILSLEGSLSSNAIETFFGAYGIVRQKLSQIPGASSIKDYKQTLNLYILYVAASYSHSMMSKHIEGETAYPSLPNIQNINDEYLLINELIPNYLKTTRICRTGKELAQTTKGYFTRIKEITKRSLSSKQNSNILRELQNNIIINFEDGNQSFSALKQRTSKKKRKNIEDEKITFDDIGGNHQAKKELIYLVKSITHPDRKKYGYKPPRGIFFYGHPGTGKTLSAKALANESGVPFHNIDITDVLSKWYGESERNLKNALSQDGIIFIDEYDSLGRVNHQDNNGYSQKLVNIIAETMDGYDSNPNTIYIASSNSLKIERKLKRAGRFSKFIFFGSPDYKDIREILTIHLKKLQQSSEMQLFNGVNVNQIASRLHKKSQEEQKRNKNLIITGADIKEIIRRTHEAQWNKFLDSDRFHKITTTDFEEEIQKYNMEQRL